MKNKNTCVNNHESAVSENSGSASLVPSNPMPQSMTDLGCTFTKVTKNGKPVLLARLNVQAQPTTTETLSALLHHAEELNLRLPFLRVSVRMNTDTVSSKVTSTEITSTEVTNDEVANRDVKAPPVNGVHPHYLFVLQGLSHHGITARNISNFLNRLTHDFKIFLAYTEAHSIQVQPSLENSAVKPFI